MGTTVLEGHCIKNYVTTLDDISIYNLLRRQSVRCVDEDIGIDDMK